MDFDHRFNKRAFRTHIRRVGFQLTDEDFSELLKRTTRTTRGGDAFSFKPARLAVGAACNGTFFYGFESQIAPEGTDLSAKESPSSFWLRFGGAGSRFQFRAYCSNDLPALRFYEGIIPYRDVAPGGICVKARRLQGHRVEVQVMITTERPPHLIVRMPKPLSGKDTTVFDRDATEADYIEGPHERDAGTVSPLGNDTALVKPGVWLSHRFSFDMSLRQYKLFWQCMVRLRSIGFRPNFSHPDRSLPEDKLESQIQLLASQPFAIQYLIEGLISHNVITMPELPGVLTYLSQLSADIPHFLEIMYTRKRKSGTHISFYCRDISRLIVRVPNSPTYCVCIRRCFVTPLRVLLFPPALEVSNSVLRKFSQHIDRFLRVEFAGEQEALRVSFEAIEIDSALHGEQGVFARIRRVLKYGLNVAGRHYTFLASSESQAREHSCWMISETEDFTREKVINWMGDFSKETVIAKHAARLGLSFSTTRSLDLDVIVQKESDPYDIKDPGRNKLYRFTDGAGTFSQTLANRCAKALGESFTSAAQVRLPGCKGVLSVKNGMKDDEVLIRDSMVKFESRSLDLGKKARVLNVLKIAKYSPGSLNRQAILLLESQGVPKDVLVQIFKDEKARIERLGNISDDPINALIYLESAFPLVKAIKAGFNDDPFIGNLLRVTKCRLLSELKWKARVELRDGTFLMGIPDEMNILQEGQVFCQISAHPPFGEPFEKVITGQCTIYRNPCLHPGDVRLVEAVDIPELHFLKNVIVFPTRGRRDLPSMLSGGDLDGDYYTLIWDKRLLIKEQYEPMDYTGPTPSRVPLVTVEHTKQFFLNSMMNDVLGIVANAHMAFADSRGPKSEKCLELAKMHSDAVDFRKTGVRVHLKGSQLPQEYPDFMGKEDRDCYESQNALGQMFRLIDPDPVYQPVVIGEYHRHSFKDVHIDGQYLQEAARLRVLYDSALHGWMLRYKVKTEAECVSGLIASARGHPGRKKRDHARMEEIRIAFGHFKSSFLSEAKNFTREHPHRAQGAARSDVLNLQGKEAFAIACYKTVYDRESTNGSSDGIEDEDTEEDDGVEDDVGNPDFGDETVFEPAKEARALSFAWLFPEELIAVRGRLRP